MEIKITEYENKALDFIAKQCIKARTLDNPLPIVECFGYAKALLDLNLIDEDTYHPLILSIDQFARVQLNKDSTK